MLRRQEFVELCRGRDLSTAILYAKKHFPPFFDAQGANIEQAITLLAFPQETTLMPYTWLYDLDRWKDISEQFDRDNRSLHGLPERSQLVSLIHTGLSTLKTPQCSPTDIKEMVAVNINCPVCTTPLSSIAQFVPFAHHETSLLVCPITGQIMDADNPPMVLPNGYVYSSKALDEMASSLGGSVICPRSRTEFRIAEARKCFI